MTPDWSTIHEFENKIAKFFGAPYAVAVDSCTHGIELCLRLINAGHVMSPRRTYVSIPMLAQKLGYRLIWNSDRWKEYYWVTHGIIDAATFWKKDGYLGDDFMVLSFQHQKHLSLGRGGMILCPDKESADILKKMSYDGRLPGIPWREQDIDTMGYHYYMTPETAQKGLGKLQAAIDTEPRIWSHADYPDVSKMKVFNK